MKRLVMIMTFASLLGSFNAATSFSQERTEQPRPPQRERPPAVTSPEVTEDGKITVRIHAPNAESVMFSSSDYPGLGRGKEMTKNEAGIWEVTLDKVQAGAYRYNFNVDGIATIDPRNPLTSQANQNVWSLVYVPGSDVFDQRDVPHGAIAEIHYRSKSIDMNRRMHVYTPPGYESGTEAYPVFYLLHGASDNDDAWSTVGRAGFILDNLIADGRAKPMIVVMPDGHPRAMSFGQRGSSDRQVDEFVEDFNGDLKPYIESHYRVKKDRANTAIAGLSMGGAQTLNIAFPHLDQYAYVGVYSSGVFGIAGGFNGQAPNTAWVDSNKAMLDNADLKKDLKLVWFATGKDDFLIETSRKTVDTLKSHGFDVVYRETEGGHTWINWRDYLAEFAPQLFQ